MVPFAIVPALVAGLLGTLVMSAMMQGATAVGMTRMPSMTLLQGSMFTGDRRTASRIGIVTHVLMMGTIVFGLAYAAVFVAFDATGYVAGLVVGIMHGVVAGLAMAMMGSMHPRMVPATAGSDRAVTEEAAEIRIVEPGLFAKNYGRMTPVGLLVGHALYGLVVGAVYAVLL